MNDNITKARLRSINDKIYTAMEMVNNWTGDEEETSNILTILLAKSVSVSIDSSNKTNCLLSPCKLDLISALFIFLSPCLQYLV
jgi:hypothetical protein